MPTSARGRDPAVEEEFLGALYKGGELLASGKIVEAREHLEKAHGLAPRNEKAQNLLGLTYFKLGLFDQASEVYEKLVNENPTDATLRVNLGLVYLKTNNLERCIKEFETATDLEPTHKKAHNYLGLALAQQGTYAKAKDHFVLAGSDQMAEKMGRALAAQSSPSGFHAPVSRQAPKSIVLGEDAGKTAPPAPVALAPVEEEPIEVMSDEELPSDVYVVPEEVTVVAPAPSAPGLSSDWGAQLKPVAAPVGEIRFAEDEGPPAASLQSPVEELPVLDAVVETVTAETGAEGNGATPDWLTMEAAEAARTGTAPAESGWVTESVSEVPLPAEPEPAPTTEAAAAEVPLGATDDRWGQSTPPANDESWATQDAPPLDAVAQPEAAAEWVTQEAPAPEPVQEQSAEQVEASWAAVAQPETTTEWVTQEAPAPEPEQALAQPETAAEWVAQEAPAAEPEQTLAQPETAAEWVAQEPVSEAEQALAPPETAAEWVAQEAPVEQSPAPEASGEWAAQEVPVEQSPTPETAGEWAAQEAPQAEAQSEAAWAAAQEPVPTTPDDASWATAQEPLPTTPDDASWATAPTQEPLPTTPDDESWAVGPAQPQPEAPGIEPLPEPVFEAAASAIEAPPPSPSAPLNITVEEPQEAPAPAAQYTAPAAPAGYAPMSPQRLVDLGASGSWVQEPSAGPFHISTDGLAVTVNGEMMVRLVGLVAIVGGVEVKPENRRRRGRSSAEPFGTGTSQLQRVTGNGVLYLEPGRSKFHAVDLTDQNGVSIDDDGAYLREEMVFAFEEAISFENGRLTAEGQSLDLAHLKGNGRVLLQLDGTLRAMPIPLGAPMVVPLHRVVGWFGRVSPRLMGFGGRGAIELTGEGYALLGTPAEAR